MERLIPIINKLQDVFNTVNSQPVDLPQIAVVGSQSTGKSSVLESLVGNDFLPRGNGIVTRRPLVLQLVNTADTKEKYGMFLHAKEKKFTDFDDIRAEIEKETARIAPGQGVSAQAINLRIYSPDVLNLTMVDLPGLTKVPVGNQPSDIQQQIRDLVLKYISRENCIILAVSAANSDLATSDAIQIAKEVDPNGNRTIGVLTKVDLMDKGTNCCNILQGGVIPLKLGYFAVINRSQQDINEKKSVEHARTYEKEFFLKNPAYRQMSDRLGFPTLASYMNTILIRHIKQRLPALKQDIHSNVQLLTEELQQYGESMIDGVENKGALLLHLLGKFSNNFNSAIDGTGGTIPPGRELYGGARIVNIFHSVFQGELDMIDAYAGLDDETIRMSIRNSCGARLALFVPDLAFEMLVRQQIGRLRVPCLSCVERVFEELGRVCAACETPEITRFKSLSVKINEVIAAMMRRFLDPCMSYCNQIIDIELAYINTKHPDFISGGKAAAHAYADVQRKEQAHSQPQKQIAQKQERKRSEPKREQKAGLFSFFHSNDNHAAPRKKQRVEPQPVKIEMPKPEPMNAREAAEVKIIKNLLSSYFAIVKKSVLDSIPKAIMHFLVNQSKTHIQSELVGSLYKEGKFDALLSENPEIAMKRKQCRELLNVLKRALEIVGEVRDFKVAGI